MNTIEHLEIRVLIAIAENSRMDESKISVDTVLKDALPTAKQQYEFKKDIEDDFWIDSSVADVVLMGMDDGEMTAAMVIDRIKDVASEKEAKPKAKV